MEEKQNKKNIGVIGGGSWATAIIKMLCENVNSVNWWMRNEDAINHIETYGHNPNYISDADLKVSKLCLKQFYINLKYFVTFGEHFLKLIRLLKLELR